MAKKADDPLATIGDRCRTNRELGDDDRTARNRLLWEESEAGAKVRELADRSGLSRSQVHRIIIEEDRKRQRITIRD